MLLKTVRNYAKRGDALPIPNLVRVQQEAYKRFLQLEKEADQRDPMIGLESLLREVFPIESYDGNMQLEYVHFKLDEPRYTPLECKELRLTYGLPFRIRVRLVRKDVAEIPEEDIYLGEIPILMGGGEYIINGAERVIVNQLHRSPGVDFSIVSAEGDRPLHSARIIPERGSWIELEVTKKDVLVMRIDQSTKIPATTFLRAIDEDFSTTDTILRTFYDVREIPVAQLKPDHFAAAPIIDTETGEELVRVGAQIGSHIEKIQASNLKTVEIVDNVSDELILNTIAEEKQAAFEELQVTEHEMALLQLYARLRPGNPPQVDKARQLFAEKFFDENRYRLGKVGRFRINRKFDLEVPELEMKLRAEDFLHVIMYLLDLRSNRNKAHVDDIDHLGNRRLRTLDELAVEELRKGFLKLRRTVQERMSVKDPDELAKIADLINSKSISSAIEHFFGRSELSQVVDQTNPLSMLKHERTLSAMGPGGLNRKRAGFEVRDVHISHYGRICPIETPEGTNIGLISSLGIYSHIDEYGFLQTPYRVAKAGELPGEIVYLRADEEMKVTLAPTDVIDYKSGKLTKGQLLARVDGDLSQVDSKSISYIDVSPKQIVGVSAALIPFLEHDDANRALMGSNMQRQAVPLIKTQPPCVATGMEMEIPRHSGMVVRAKNAGTITYVDAQRIIIDNADEYELRKFVGLNEKTCLNQRPIVRIGQKVKADQIIADGAATSKGELALGKNVLVAFNTFDGYNFEDAIVINERLVKEDTFTSIHIEEFDVEIRETKLGREEFTRDIPNVSERQLARLDENGVIQIGSYVKPGDILVGKVSPKSKSELTPEEKLLHAIFGRAGEDVKNDSLEVPAGTEGVVIGARRFSRRMHLNEEQKKTLKREMREYEELMDRRAAELFRQMVEQINEVTGGQMVDPSTRQKVGASELTEVVLEQIESFSLNWVKGSKEARQAAEVVHKAFWPRIMAIEKEKQRRLAHMKRGDELASGVLEMVKVYLATKRALSVGDKMAGRHGNKGVIARIVPEEDMPFLEDGTSVDVLLNPLGVPSRMNVGQILETHLGWACGVLGFQAVTPVFDGATEAEIHEVIEEANTYVARRREEIELSGNNNWLKTITDAYDAKNDDQVLSQGIRRWLSSFKVLYTDQNKPLTADELNKLEEAVIVSFPDGDPRDADRRHLPRFNREPKKVADPAALIAEVRASDRLRPLYEASLAAINGTDGKNWIRSDKAGFDLVADRQGLYFFRNPISGHVNEGYIGQAAKLKSRLQMHLSSRSGNNWVQRIQEEANYQVNTYKTPRAFDAKEILAPMPAGGKVQLHDGRTGEPFHQKTTVGHMYLLKLHHLVDDKIHARATGPYSLITQQPLGGKARTGGQRFGEMEVWALEAYGAAYILQELLTVKSDDVEGRTKIYESMVKGTNTLEAGMPVAFDVLCNEIKGLGLNITMEKTAADSGSIL